jgi:hypothetical protein
MTGKTSLMKRNCPFCNANPATYTRDPAAKREVFDCYTTIDNVEPFDPELNVVNRSKTCLRRQQESQDSEMKVREAAAAENMKRMYLLRGMPWPVFKRPSDNWAAPSRDELCEEIQLLKGENCILVDQVETLQSRLGKSRINLAIKNTEILKCNEIIKNLRANYSIALAKCKVNYDVVEGLKKELKMASTKLSVERASNDLRAETIVRLQAQHNTLLDENRWLRSKVDQ